MSGRPARLGALVAAALLCGSTLALGCGDATPEGDDLASPADAAAVPRSEEDFEQTAAERKRERVVESMREVEEPPELPGR